MKYFPRDETRDLDEYLNDEGKDKFLAYINDVCDKFTFLLYMYEGGSALKTMKDKKRFINIFLEKLAALDEGIEKDDIILKLARITGFEVEAIKRAVIAYNRQSEKKEVLIDSVPTFQRKEQIKRYSRLKRAERSILYYMLNEMKAVDFFEKNVSFFIDDIYRNIANLVIAYAKEHGNINSEDIISMLSLGEHANKDELVKTICDLDLDETLKMIPYSEEAMKEYLKVIQEEKKKLSERDFLSRSLQGKPTEEKARIIKDYTAERDRHK